MSQAAGNPVFLGEHRKKVDKLCGSRKWDVVREVNTKDTVEPPQPSKPHTSPHPCVFFIRWSGGSCASRQPWKILDAGLSAVSGLVEATGCASQSVAGQRRDPRALVRLGTAWHRAIKTNQAIGAPATARCAVCVVGFSWVGGKMHQRILIYTLWRTLWVVDLHPKS